MNSSKRYIMVVEDSEGFASVLCELLSQGVPSHKTLIARSVEEAQTLACEFEFDLFIVDINLPDGSGFDFLCDIRTVQPEAKALVITAAPLPEYRNHAKTLGALQFFEKPFDFDQFISSVRRIVHRADPEAKGASFQGTLRQLQLADVIQLKCFSGADSRLVFEGPHGESGEIHIERGQIVHAQVGTIEGVAAFEMMVGWGSGRFLEGEPEPDCPHTIDQEWQSLLMETARKLDESRSPTHS